MVEGNIQTVKHAIYDVNVNQPTSWLYPQLSDKVVIGWLYWDWYIRGQFIFGTSLR